MAATSKFRLSRRTVLAGAGGIAIALPWLEIMTRGRRARAATSPAKRFLAVYQPGGTVLSKWTPTGTETNFVLSPILAPFEPVKDKILVFSGIDMKSAVGEQRQAGIIAWLTGSVQANLVSATSTFSKDGPSIDQVLAPRLSAGKRKPNLYLAVRWGTGRSHGKVSPWNIANFGAAAPYSPMAPSLDPVAIWKDLFGTVPADAWDKSILDFVDRRYVKLAARLGAADRQRLDEHLTNLRDIERRVATTARCTAPVLVDTSDYNPTSGLMSADDGSLKDLATDAAIPKVGKLMMDMMVMAFACDITGAGTLQWSDTEAKHTFPWLGLPEHHAFYQNDGGYHPIECEKIATWYSTQHAYLVQQLANVDMGGHSLLDETVVFFGSERQDPANYSKANMPFVLAGGGGLRTGRWLQYASRSHNELLVALLNLFGDARTTFGTAQYSTGTLTNLT